MWVPANTSSGVILVGKVPSEPGRESIETFPLYSEVY